VKPHLLLPFWIVLGLWTWDQRRWRVLIGAVAAFAALVIGSLAIDPAIFDQYRAALAAHHPTHIITPTLGSLLRFAFGADHYWLQFVPTVLGAAWVILYWSRRRDRWDWTEQLPVLVLVSLLTTAYLYVYDLVLLLVPTIAVAAQVARTGRTRWAIAIHVGLSGAALAMNLARVPDFTYVWFVPAALFAYHFVSSSQLSPIRASTSS
jgi:hypothetical protein